MKTIKTFEEFVNESKQSDEFYNLLRREGKLFPESIHTVEDEGKYLRFYLEPGKNNDFVDDMLSLGINLDNIDAKYNSNTKSWVIAKKDLVIKENLNEGKTTWTVVSQDAKTHKWGIEGDFDAKDDDEAIDLAEKQAKKYGAKRQMFYAFPAESQELQDFIDRLDFID